MYNISLTHISCRSQWPFIKYLWMVVFLKRGAVYDHFGPSRPQPQWHQPKKFLFPYPPRFLVRTLRRHPPDISAQLCLSLQCCVAIGFASQSIPGMKAFQFGLEMRFFYLYLRVRSFGRRIWKSAKKVVRKKCQRMPSLACFLT